MATTTIQIGSKVNYSTGKFMKNGIVTGMDLENKRAFVKFPIHGSCSINICNLIVIQ